MARAGSVLRDPAARRLTAGDLEAVFLPGFGMLGASLRLRGEELLGRIEDLDTAAAKGSTAGIPLLYPWANRLAGLRYRAAGLEVVLDPASPILHLDDRGLPIHGVPWAQLAWEATAAAPDALRARLDWTASALLAVFPFRHRVELDVGLRPDGLTVATTVTALGDGPVPVSFGFHPYFSLTGMDRARWRLLLPSLRRLALDPRGIPTGEEADAPPVDAELDDRAWDDGFALHEPGRAALALAGAGRRITVELLSGYRFAQVFAPRDKPFVALEPMTAPANALVSGSGLSTAEPGVPFRASFRIRVEDFTG
ncbi:MAG TPA: aldose 1-epimerase [Myxococcaceae bacterium]|nr:aldose 1-epimerase [Myxococcaceae bacterium]